MHGRAHEVPRRLRDQATITWRNDELKKAYEQALAKRAKPRRQPAPAQSRSR